MNRLFATLAVVLSAAAVGASAPATRLAQRLHGKIETNATVLRAVAVDRGWADAEKVSKLTATKGAEGKDEFIYEAVMSGGGGEKAFRVENLLPGRAYDLILWTRGADGVEVRWEGANMEYHRDIKASTPATGEDRKAIEAAVTEPVQFYDKVRVLRIAADHGHATALVELLRTRDFHSDKGGEVIYRVELWYYENLFGGWAKDKNTERVLMRLRGDPRRLPANVQFEPSLGGVMLAEAAVMVALPEKADPRHGIAGGIK